MLKAFPLDSNALERSEFQVSTSLFIRIYWSCIWSSLWQSSLFNFSGKGVLKKYQHLKKFSIWDVYLCRRVYTCVSSFPQMLFPILILNIFLPRSFPDLSSPSYVCLTFYFSGCEPLSLIWKESKNSVWFPIRCRVNALKFSLDCVCFPHIPYG